MPRRNKEREEREKADKAKEKEMDLRDKAQACIVFRERGHLLDKSSSTELQHIVRFLCCVEKKGKGDSYSSHAGSKKKLKERMAEVQPVWTKYFEMAARENDANGGDDARLEPIVENKEEILK